MHRCAAKFVNRPSLLELLQAGPGHEKELLGIIGTRFLQACCLWCCPTSSVKTLKETRTIDFNQEKSTAILIVSWSPTDSWEEGCHNTDFSLPAPFHPIQETLGKQKPPMGLWNCSFSECLEFQFLKFSRDCAKTAQHNDLIFGTGYVQPRLHFD